MNRLSFILNWLFSVSRQQSVGAAILAVIITEFYAGKLDFCFIAMILLSAPMPSSPSSSRSRRLPCSGERTGGDGFGDDGVALFDVVNISGRPPPPARFVAPADGGDDDYDGASPSLSASSRSRSWLWSWGKRLMQSRLVASATAPETTSADDDDDPPDGDGVS